ncbi:MAG TPA: hypothetical protein VKU82_06710 [Planctomycetaceae bacterium]|nr:hypothetical protein [Planctomycetaceae bacterium]
MRLRRMRWFLAWCLLALCCSACSNGDASPPAAEPGRAPPEDALDAGLSGKYTVKRGHPRLFVDSDIAAKAKTRDGAEILKAVTACAQGPADKTGDRLICAAFLYQFGSQIGVDESTRAKLGKQAVSDLLELPAFGPNYGTLLYILAPGACGYDWLYDLLTAEQKQELLAKFKSVMDNRDIAKKPGCLQWFSSNNVAGFGMTLAVATEGDYPGKQYVADYYHNNWWKPGGIGKDGFNWWCVRNNLAGGGNREGFGYFWGTFPNWFSKAAFESATGNRDLQSLDYFSKYPYWILFQTAPDYKKGTPIWSLPTITYSNELDYDRAFMEFLMCSTSWSDDDGKQLARWLLDQSLGYTTGAGSVGRLLLFGLVIGDPGVVGKSPKQLDLPLERVLMPYGEVFQRTNWTPDATCFYFGCGTHQSRVYPMNDLTIWSKGQPLLPHREQLYQHSYAPFWLRNSVCFVDKKTNKLAFEYTQADPQTTALGNLTKNSDGSYTGDATKLWARPQVKLARRTVSPDLAGGVVTVLDELQCDSSIVPHVTWNTPHEPNVAADGSIAFKCGKAACVMTFDQAPAKVLTIGGPGHEIDGLDGKPYTPHVSMELSANWVAEAEELKIRHGGRWRVHVVPAGGKDGAFRLQTTIKIK